MPRWPRRTFLKFASAALPNPLLGCRASLFSLSLSEPPPSSEAPKINDEQPVSDLFPTQSPELAREMVTVSHYSLRRVQELVEARPSLARAAWDWGFGDWETALGAASHMGNRPIAEYLISKGARPSLFSSAMLGHLEVVKAFVAAQPDVQRIRGPHSIPLLAHAQAGGAAARPVLEFLQTLGDAGADPLTPLSDSDAQNLRGIYTFGPAMSQQIEVTYDNGQVTWTRNGMMGRPLFYVGDGAFYPAGTPAARIRFRPDGPAMVMTIEDPDVVLIAHRKPAAS